VGNKRYEGKCISLLGWRENKFRRKKGGLLAAGGPAATNSKGKARRDRVNARAKLSCGKDHYNNLGGGIAIL